MGDRLRSRFVVAAAVLAWGFVSAHARAEEASMPDAPGAAQPLPAPAAPAPAAPAPAAAVPVTTAPASAAEPAALTREESIHPLVPDDPPSRWYGWQTLAADGAALALIVGSVAIGGAGDDSPSAAMGLGSLGTYALGAPILHLAHGNPGRGVGSLGMRIGGPIVLAMLGIAAEGCGENGGDFCGFGGSIIGATTGIIAAVVVDAAVFAYDDRPDRSAMVPRFQLGLGPRGVVAAGSF